MKSSVFPKISKLKKYTKKLGQKNIIKIWKKSRDIYLIEKRKRNQIYVAMDYDFFSTTIGQFVSKDVLKILQCGKFVSYLLGKQIVTSEMLLYGFFDKKNTSLSAFKIGKITKEKIIQKLSEKLNPTSDLDIKIKQFFFYPYHIYLKYLQNPIQKYFKENDIISTEFDEEIISSTEIRFDSEIYDVLRFAGKIAKERFNTPIITQEILFIALLESVNSTAGKLLLKLIPTKESWLLLRYKFIQITKKIERIIDTFLPPGLLYYDFVLRTNMLRNDFDKLLLDPVFHLFFILKYRKKLLDRLLEIDFLEKIKKQTYYSLFYEF